MAAHSLFRLQITPAQAVVLNTMVRLYLECCEDIPEQHRPPIRTPIIDCEPHEAAALKRRLTKLGYSVLAVPL